MLSVAFNVTLPVGFTQGAPQVNVKLALPVMGDIASLKEALTLLVVSDTEPLPLTGATAVTVGADAGVLAGVELSLPPQLAAKALQDATMHHIRSRGKRPYVLMT
jgi:hypothetical protein